LGCVSGVFELALEIRVGFRLARIYSASYVQVSVEPTVGDKG
jgi:hypothetical protein